MEAHEVRSLIINWAINTELLIAEVIRDYFVNEEDKAIKFKDFILSKEFFTFEQKIRVFGKILEELRDLKLIRSNGQDFQVSRERKGFIKKIRYIQEIRNAIVHNHHFTKKTSEPYVEYSFKNKIKEIILDEEFSNKFYIDYIDIWWILRDLKDRLNEKN